MDPKDRDNSRVWRIELRAGKDLLKDRWNIRTFPEFSARFGDLLTEATKAVRYTQPLANDDNRARWPNHAIWDVVAQVVESEHEDMREFCDPDKTRDVNREEHISKILLNIAGLSVTYAALHGKTYAQLEAFQDQTKADISALFRKRPEKYAKLLKDAKARYRFR